VSDKIKHQSRVLYGDRIGTVTLVQGNRVHVKLDGGGAVETALSRVTLVTADNAGKVHGVPSFDHSPADLPGTLTLCVVAKSQHELDGWMLQHATGGQLVGVDELIAVNNEKGRFGGYGAVAARALALASCEVFGLTHADTAYREGALGVFRDTAAAGVVAGMVGRPMTGHYVWSKQGGMLDPSCLDGCAIFFRKDSKLQFDVKTFDGFHCVGEDIALAARSKGMQLVIPAADADHASTSNFVPGEPPGNPAWLKDYGIYTERLKKKYPNLEFMLS
jgi:hypothetical protein